MTESHSPGVTPSDLPEAHLPDQHWPLPEVVTLSEHPHPSATSYQQVQASDDFQRLRSAFRQFAFPTVAAVIAWYLFYVLASVIAVPGQPSFMGTKVMGNLTMGMAIGLLQFPTTWLATWFYVRRMDAKLDPLAAQIREQIESEVAA